MTAKDVISLPDFAKSRICVMHCYLRKVIFQSKNKLTAVSMKNILIRFFLLASLVSMPTGCLTDSCDDDDYDISKLSNPEFDVYPKTTVVGDTVYCVVIKNGDAEDISWRIDEKPYNSNASIQSISGSQDAFFIPDVFGIYNVTAGYNKGASKLLRSDPFTISVLNLRAFAGDDITVMPDTTLLLDGSGSFGEQLSYFWNIISTPLGAIQQIINPTSVFATYHVDLPGDYFVQLKVTDIYQNSDYDTLKITATDVPTGDIWTTLTDYPGEGTHGIVAVSVGSFGYVGLGATTTNDIKKDFWKFDPAGNGGLGSWTQLSDFPANDTRDCAAFVLNNKIYVGLGGSSNPIETSRIFFVYDPLANSWDNGSVVPLFPGAPRQNASAFVLDGEAYVGLGYQNTWPGLLFDDMYKYSTAATEWDSLNSFPGGARFAAISFVLNNIPYIGYGAQILPMGYIDLWSYNKSDDTWTSVPPIQPLASSDFYYHSIGVATSTNGYLIGGAIQQTDNGKQVWAFNSSSWTRKTNSIAGLTYSAGFVINDKVYCGGGTKKWYRYDPSLDQSNSKPLLSSTNRKSGQ